MFFLSEKQLKVNKSSAVRNAERKGKTKSQTIFFQYFWTRVSFLYGTSWKQNHNKNCIYIWNIDFVEAPSLEKLRFLVRKGIIHMSLSCLLSWSSQLFGNAFWHEQNWYCRCVWPHRWSGSVHMRVHLKGYVENDKAGSHCVSIPQTITTLISIWRQRSEWWNRFESCYCWLCQELWITGSWCSRVCSGTLETAGLKNPTFCFSSFTFNVFLRSGLPSWNQLKQCNLRKEIRKSLVETNVLNNFRCIQEMSVCSRRTNHLEVVLRSAEDTLRNRSLVSLEKLVFEWYLLNMIWYLLYMIWLRRRILPGELILFNTHTGKLLTCLQLCFTHGQGQTAAILFVKCNSLFPLRSSYSVKWLQVKRKRKKSWKSELVFTENAHDLCAAGSHLSQILLVGYY